MNPKRNPVVTRGQWGYGSTSGSGIDGAQITAHRFRESKRTGHKFISQRGQLDGVTVKGEYDERYAEINRLGLLYGYLQRFGRNTCGFVMSRAARKRGYAGRSPANPAHRIDLERYNALIRHYNQMKEYERQREQRAV